MNLEKPIDVVIPAAVGGAPGIARIARSGRIITCLASTGEFFLSKDGGPRFTFNAGRVIGDSNADEFTWLMLYNAGAADVTTQLLLSYTPYTGELPVSATINTVVTVTGKNAPTYTKGTTGNIAAGATVAFTGLDTTKVRKSFSVFNNHGADDLHVRGQNGTLMHIVPARTGYPVEAGGTITLFNPGANAINYAVSEVFYS
jgi:hypothetical protein